MGSPARIGERRARYFHCATLVAALGTTQACALESQEAERVDVPVVVAETEPELVNDLGVELRLTRARLAISDLEFTTQGEASALDDDPGARIGALWQGRPRLVRSVWAHPGHLEGGEVIGELPGRFVIDWIEQGGRRLGDAQMLTAQYDSVNFAFQRADDDDVGAGDPMLGHSVQLEGVAQTEAGAYPFIAWIDQDPGRPMVGGAFQAQVRLSSQGPVSLELRPRDPVTGATLFDGVDFAALADALGLRAGETIEIRADIEATRTSHNRIRNALQRHEFYGAELRTEG